MLAPLTTSPLPSKGGVHSSHLPSFVDGYSQKFGSTGIECRAIPDTDNTPPLGQSHPHSGPLLSHQGTGPSVTTVRFPCPFSALVSFLLSPGCTARRAKQTAVTDQTLATQNALFETCCCFRPFSRSAPPSTSWLKAPILFQSENGSSNLGRNWISKPSHQWTQCSLLAPSSASFTASYPLTPPLPPGPSRIAQTVLYTTAPPCQRLHSAPE